MRFYVTDGRYYATKGEAMKAAREAARQAYDFTPVDLVDVTIDKANVLRMLNNDGGHTDTIETVEKVPGKLI